MTKFARKKWENDIKKLKGNGIKGYMYEVKIVSKNIGSYRLLGNMNDEGKIVWKVFEKTHK